MIVTKYQTILQAHSVISKICYYWDERITKCDGFLKKNKIEKKWRQNQHQPPVPPSSAQCQAFHKLNIWQVMSVEMSKTLEKWCDASNMEIIVCIRLLWNAYWVYIPSSYPSLKLQYPFYICCYLCIFFFNFKSQNEVFFFSSWRKFI